ncbi:MAG: DMT family transporter [Thaumarchaeota archaeon]|nr:DMT family transporter [Nitrososphaerota archaeon]
MAPARLVAPYILITAFQYFLAKDALGRTSPFVFGAMTTLLTCVAFFALSRGFKLILNRETIIFSIIYWMSGASWLLGLNYISPPQSAIISFTMPLFVIPLAVWVLNERGTRVEIYGAIVGFAGIVLFNVPLLSGTSTDFGIVLTLADAFFWALFSVLMRRLRSQDAVQTLATASFVSFLLYGAFSFADFGLRPSLDLAVDVTFLGLVSGALNFYIWMALIKVEKVGRLTTLIFLAPIITLTYSVATTGVIPSYITLGGVALIFVGIYSANIIAARQPRPPPNSPSSTGERGS